MVAIISTVAARAELETPGFALPLAEMRWWLLGIPAPGEASVDADATSGDPRVRAAGLRIGIDARAPARFSLPQRLTATREGARIKLLLEQWRP